MQAGGKFGVTGDLLDHYLRNDRSAFLVLESHALTPKEILSRAAGKFGLKLNKLRLGLYTANIVGLDLTKEEGVDYEVYLLKALILGGIPVLKVIPAFELLRKEEEKRKVYA